jgi:hypothetical protein
MGTNLGKKLNVKGQGLGKFSSYLVIFLSGARLTYRPVVIVTPKAVVFISGSYPYCFPEEKDPA